MADLNIGNSSASVVVNAKHNGSVTPQINNTYDLGTSELRWKNIYGNLKGNADTATTATNDSAGQQINTTYIKGLSVSGKTITYTKGNGATGTITTQDTNTWRGIQNNLTSTSTIDSLSAAQGKILNETKAVNKTLTNEDLNTVTTPGFYNAGGGNSVINKPSGVEHFGLIVVHNANGTYYTQNIFNDNGEWKRTCTNGTWGSWINVTVQTAVPANAKFTDTLYTHPTSSGNKHIPSGGSSGQILRWSADGTAVWGADNNTTYSANTGIKLNGTTFQHTNSVTAGTAQGDANKTLIFGGTFTIPTITYDAQGHITGKGTTTMTMPANPNTDTKVTQTAINSADYTNWRPLIWGSSNSKTEGFTPSTVTDGVYTAQTLSCQPSTGTIKATTFKGSLSGNAATATKLATARTINGTSFNGSANITTANWGTARTLTIGNTGKSVNGSSNISWTLSEIGAAASGHTHAAATTSANGFMSSADKAKLDGITASADAVSFSRSLTSGTKVGTITINGTGTDLYAPTNTDTKNTTGSTDTSSKIFLVGATSQSANPQTYSDNQVYAQNGQLNGNSIRVAEKVTLQYDVTNECLNFVFN